MLVEHGLWWNSRPGVSRVPLSVELWSPVARSKDSCVVPSVVPQREPRARFPGRLFKIGETGFEPATARPPAECATRLRHSPWGDRVHSDGSARSRLGCPCAAVAQW